MPSQDYTMTRRTWLQTAWTLTALTCISGLGVLLAGPGYRVGWWGLGPGLKLIAWSGFATCAWLLLSLILAAVVYRKHGLTLVTRFLLAAVIAGLTVAPLAFYGIKAKRLPPIHDISTDLVNPPEFAAVLALRKDAKNPAQYDPKLAPLQSAAYPDIAPIHLQQTPAVAFKKAVQVAKAMNWDIVAIDPDALRIEATATTLLFGFKDDIVIRVLPEGAARTWRRLPVNVQVA